MKPTLGVAALILLITGIAASTNASAQSYTYTDLGAASEFNSVAEAINNSGQIVGWSYGLNSSYSATLWNGTASTNLGVGTIASHAYGINDSGQIAGWSVPAANTGRYATLWNGTTPTNLGAPLGGTAADALGINNSGQVVGDSFTTGNGRYLPVSWNGTSGSALGTISGQAFGINNSGQVVGWVSPSSGVAAATLWNGTTPTNLPTLGGTTGFANAINDSGLIVGESDTTGNMTQDATLWNGTTPTDLGKLLNVNGASSQALAINKTGQIAGSSNTFDANSPVWVEHATFWNGTGIIDLNSLIGAGTLGAGWYLHDRRASR